MNNTSDFLHFLFFVFLILLLLFFLFLLELSYFFLQIFFFLFPITAKKVADDDCDCEWLAILLSIIYYLYLCGLAFWYIWDLVYFGKNKYLDYTYKTEIGEGISFEPW